MKPFSQDETQRGKAATENKIVSRKVAKPQRSAKKELAKGADPIYGIQFFEFVE